MLGAKPPQNKTDIDVVQLLKAKASATGEDGVDASLSSLGIAVALGDNAMVEFIEVD